MPEALKILATNSCFSLVQACGQNSEQLMGLLLHYSRQLLGG
jgi:hypothetical protein